MTVTIISKVNLSPVGCLESTILNGYFRFSAKTFAAIEGFDLALVL